MTIFANLFVARPWLQFIVGIFFLAAYYISLRYRKNQSSLKHNRILLLPMIIWLAWGIWEWAILRFSPEANIRIDLLIILPAALLVSIAVVIVFFKKSPSE